MDHIQLHDLTFAPFLSAETIRARVQEMGRKLQQDLREDNPVFLIMLKGAFVFAADLVRAFAAPCEVSFVRAQSYRGTSSTKQLKIMLGPELEELHNRHLIIVEDIVDSGHTMARFLPMVQGVNPASVRLVTLLLKPDMLEEELEIDQYGFAIPPKFVVGYGLDYDELGRHLPDIYQLATDEDD
jgi:hypoxanthine phosphoribosyltransferase